MSKVLSSLFLTSNKGEHFEILKNAHGLTILTYASSQRGNCLFIQNFSSIASQFFGETEKPAALVGFEDKAVPVSVNMKNLLETTANPKIPNISFLSSLKSADEVHAQLGRKEKVSSEKIANAIILPPWLTKAVLTVKASRFEDVFVTILHAAK